MNIEDLNKSQIVLLTLLVSFVTSIATGIVTVTLMDQAPEGVTRTITHVVERTVDTVKPGETQVASVVREVPIVVTEEDLVLKAINTASPAVGSLMTHEVKRTAVSQQLGTAFLISSSGRFVTSGKIVQPKIVYDIKMENGSVFRVKVIAESSGGQVAVLEIVPEDVAFFASSAKDIKPLSLAEGAISVGQSVIGIGSGADGNHSVAMGIVSNLAGQTASSSATMIYTNASAVNNIGGPLIDIRGKLIGLNDMAGVALGKKVILSLIDGIAK
ncbi:MAG: serine protease Do [Patescibacteria group bacterium]|nr:serine protease Do [Patescibacteria group bacterium]